MDDEDNVMARMEAHRNWEKAHTQATFEDLLSRFTGSSNELLSFDDVQRTLRLTQKNYSGVHDITLSQIRGSVGRYKDFTQTFLPRHRFLRERWERVNAVSFAQGVPPIEVYKVGDAYFVLDGNHRVSVAKQYGFPTIQAHVYEFDTSFGLSGEANLDELLIKSEYLEFLENTGLKESRPDVGIQFTVPGRYRELEYMIGVYKPVLEQIDEEEISFQEAAALWYDLIYSPSVQIIKERNALEQFPGRTEADLFVWVWKHNRELNEQTGEGSMLAESVDEIAQPAPIPLSPVRRLWQFIKEQLYS